MADYNEERGSPVLGVDRLKSKMDMEGERHDSGMSSLNPASLSQSERTDSLLSFPSNNFKESLDPGIGSGESLDPGLGSITESLEPVIGSVDESVDPGFTSVGESLDAGLGSITESIEPIIGPVDESVDPGFGSAGESFDPRLDSVNKSLNVEKNPHVSTRNIGTEHENTTQIHRYLEKITHIDEDGDTPLHNAVVCAQQVACAHFVGFVHSCDPQNELQLFDIQNKLFHTPLHLAALTRNYHALGLLLDAGADPHPQDRNGDTVLHIACRNADEQAVDIILKKCKHSPCCLLKKINYEGQSCIHLCNTNRHAGIISKLCQYNVDINVCEQKAGRTLLHIAAERGDTELVRQLVGLESINLKACAFNGATPVMLASNENKDIVRILGNKNDCEYNETDSETDDSDTEEQ